MFFFTITYKLLHPIIYKNVRLYKQCHASDTDIWGNVTADVIAFPSKMLVFDCTHLLYKRIHQD